MVSSEESKKYCSARITELLDTHCHIPVRATTPIAFYYKTSDSLIDEADFHYNKNELERSFILYSRYLIFFLETLKQKHPQFQNASSFDRARVNEIIRSKAFPRAEQLKAKLLEKYAVEYEEQQKIEKQEEMMRMATNGIDKETFKIQQENQMHYEQAKANLTPQMPPVGHVAMFPVPTTDFNAGKANAVLPNPKPTFDRSQKPIPGSSNFASGSYRQVIIPNDITPKFLQIAQQNTMRQIETCGILTGKKKDDRYVITHIVVPKQNGGPDSCDTEKEEEMLEFIAAHDLITLGWIHTHPTQTAFLSSVDLHTHLPYQMLMQEAIAIVVSPKFQETGVFSLTPEFGIPTLSTCKKTGFHEHTNASSIYTRSQHASYDPTLTCQIVDLRS